MPQHAKRVKIRRKDLRQPDEFETLTGRAVDWAERHRPYLIGAAGVVALVVAGSLMVARVRASRQFTAHEEFRKAHAVFDAARYQEADTGFAELATSYPRTPMGRLALLYRGHSLARTGDFAGAATAYAEYLATSPESPWLRQEALLDMGRAQEAADDPIALQSYAEAAVIDGPFKQDALLAEARLREATGESDRAREIYVRVAKELPPGELRELLIGKLPPGTPIASDGPDGAAPEGEELVDEPESDAAAQ